MVYPDLIDVPVEVFGGYTPAIPPSDLPPGASPLCFDVIFPEGAVKTRGGLLNYFGAPGGANNPLPVNAKVNGLKSYATPSLVQRLLAWDSLGNFYKENPQATLTFLFGRPQAAGTFYQSTTLFGREYQAFSGLDIARQYDDTNWDRVSQDGPGAPPAAVDSATVGNIAAGKHQVTVCFITRQGYITRPAVPPTTWTAGGSKQVALTAIPTGPSYVIARLVLFTPVITAPATTGTFYSLPAGTTQLATPTAMLINDNVTTTLTVDFTDAILIAGFQAQYLFTQRVLGEPSCAVGYNARLGWLGERNAQQNFVNLGFDGGFNVAPTSANSAKNPTVGANDNSGLGLGGVPWLNPGQATSSALLPSQTQSQYQKVTGFGFTIPNNAVIVGILVVISARGSANAVISDNSVMLYRNGVRVTNDLQNGNLLTNVFANQSYGGSQNLWGATWLPSDINNVNFGVAYSAFNNDPNVNRSALVQSFTVTVYYTVPGGTLPNGWTAGVSAAGGASALSGAFPVDWGDAFSITGDGATAIRGQITQSAFQDWLLTPQIARNTAYGVRIRAASANGLIQGTLHVNLSSVSGAFTTAGLSVQARQLTASYVEFIATLTNAIQSPPTDLLLQVYADGTPTNGGVFLIDSIEIYPTSAPAAPYNYSTAWLSRAFNPESYDNTLSQIQVRPNDGQQLRAGFPLRNSYYFGKDHYLCYVTDDGVNEPANWPVVEVSSTIGICGPNAVDWTEEWAVTAERSGAYIHWGGDPVKITPEIQIDASNGGKISWASINWAAAATIIVRINRANKMILIAAPVNGALTPNVVFMLDYRWLESPQDIANSPMVTYSAFTGKILSHGRGRRWTYWNMTVNSMTFAERADGTAQPFFGNGVGNGKIYEQLDATVQASDDGVAVNGRWDSYYAPSHMEEQGLRMTALRKVLGYLQWLASGTGSLLLHVQSANRVTNLRNYTLTTQPTGDAERALNLHGNRFSISVSTNAVGAWFQLEKLVPYIRKDATIPARGINA